MWLPMWEWQRLKPPLKLKAGMGGGPHHIPIYDPYKTKSSQVKWYEHLQTQPTHSSNWNCCTRSSIFLEKNNTASGAWYKGYRPNEFSSLSEWRNRGN